MEFISVEGKNQSKSKKLTKNNKKNKNATIDKLPKSAKTNNRFKNRRNNRKGGGIIYIGHIPHGFYEDEMKSYFNQFGKVIAATVSRSKKTGRSRGYGFVQFQDEEVAKIAAETMNNYLMYNKIIKCRFIPPEERKKRVWESNISTHNYPRKKNRTVDIMNKKRALSKLNQTTYFQKVQNKINEFKRYFESNGIDFTFKINDENKQDVSINNKNKETKAKTSSNQPEESENETDINGVLEIDESDNEISFETPPKVKKVIKKSLNSSVVFSSETSSVRKLKNNSNSKKIQKQEKDGKKNKILLLRKTKENKNSDEMSEKIVKKKKLLRKIMDKKKTEEIASKKIRKSNVIKNPDRKVKKN